MKEYPWQTIIGQIPSKSNQYEIVKINGHGALKKSNVMKTFERSFYLQVGTYRNLNIEGFFELYARVYFTTMSPDLDNSLKGICDCLQQTNTIKNDNRCVKIVAEKFVDKNNPRVEFRLVEI